MEVADRTSRVQPPRASPTHAAFLFVVLECGRPRAGGLRIALGAAAELTIGRGDARRVSRTRAGRRELIRVDVPDRKMSSVHARLVRHPRGLSFEDLGSTNGSFVDGLPASRVVLGHGAVLELGQTFFAYGESSDAVGGDLDGSDAAPGLATLDARLEASFARLRRIAVAPVPVLLVGETGTGKELAARAVHGLSRRPGPFVAVNCGAIPATLVESQLFGHVKGAFSGAVRDATGLARAAQFGTLFLDEIGDLPLASQAALLRVLQEGEVTPVGATRPVPVDVRIVSATHKPLAQLTVCGEFRRDLYARLAGFVATLPPLRERRVDLGLLVAALLRSRRFAHAAPTCFAVEAGRALLRHDWPLNVRELEQCLLASIALSDGEVISLSELPPCFTSMAAPPADAAAQPSAPSPLRDELVRRLGETHGNVSEVARAMGKARQQVQRWLRRFALDPRQYR